MRVQVPSDAPAATLKGATVSRKTEQMKKLIEDRDRLAKQIEALQGELRGMDRAISVMKGEAATPQEPERKPRTRNVKETVLSLVQKAGHLGLNVNELLTVAQQDNIHLERGTVSSLLSRFKRENVLDMKDGRYFLSVPPVKDREGEVIRH
jgi:hypothetical protein